MTEPNETENTMTENNKPSAGREYVKTFLFADRLTDARWIAESIDEGIILVCPRCHFLHLPVNPFPPRPYEIERHGAPVDACDVCAAVPGACDPICWGDQWEGGWQRVVDGAQDGAQDERTMRANTLYHLWIGPTNGADALRVAAMIAGVKGLRALSQTKNAPTDGEEQAGE